MKLDVSLKELASKIDYEKECNAGLYANIKDYPEELIALKLEDMLEIQDHCNDTVMKQYKSN